MCNSLHEMHIYLAKKQVPAADLTAGILPLVECVQPTEVIHVKSTTRNKYRTITKQEHNNRHSKAQSIQTQNLETFGNKTDIGSNQEIHVTGLTLCC